MSERGINSRPADYQPGVGQLSHADSSFSESGMT